MYLILYTRQGCCLCKGLEERIEKLSLQKLVPPLRLVIIDIDSNDASDKEKKQYDFQVPVLSIGFDAQNERFALPRVSPRLTGEQLFAWLQKSVANLLETLSTDT